MKKQFNKAFSLFLTVALVLSTFVTCGVLSVAAESSLSATDVVPTTRKTFTFDNSQGYITDSDATISDGKLNIPAGSNSFVFDFPLRAGKQYGINIAYSSDVTLDPILNLGYTMYSSSALSSSTVVSTTSQVWSTKPDGKRNSQYTFTLPDEAQISTANRYLYIKFNNTDISVSIDSFVVYEVGAAATFDFEDGSDIYFSNSTDKEMFMTGGSIVSPDTKAYNAALSYKVENATYSVEAVYHATRTNNLNPGFSLYKAANDASGKDTNPVVIVTSGAVGSDVPSTTVTNNSVSFDGDGNLGINFLGTSGITYVDKLTIGKAGGTVCFNGIDADDVTGYYGQSIDLPAHAPYGKILEGWYLDPECTIKVDGVTIPENSETLTLYANLVDNVNLPALNVVPTTRKTYDFETDMSGVLTNSDAVIEDGFLKFAYGSDKKILLDFPLRNEKQYAVNIVYSVDGLTTRGDITPYGLSPSGFTVGEFDIAKTGTAITGVTDKASSYPITKGDKTLLNYNYLFTVPAEIITDVNSRYISMTFKNGATAGKNIYVASITVFEVGAAATFEFDAESDFIFLAQGVNEDGKLSIPYGEGGAKAGLAYILEADTYTVRYTAKMGGESNQYTLRTASSERGYADGAKTISSSTETYTTDYRTYDKTFIVASELVTDKYNTFYINPSFGSKNRSLDYDKIFIGKAGGTVKFNGITADDVTGYYGEKVAIPSAPIGYSYELYLDAGYNVAIDAATIPASGETLNLYVKQVKKDIMIFDFADESHLDLASPEQNVKIQEGVLSLYNTSGSQSSARIPFQFEANIDYYILLDYTVNFTAPTDSAKVGLQLHYSADDITNYKHSGAYLYEYGAATNPDKANIQEFASKAFSTIDESGSLAFTFKTPSEFKTLYTDSAWTDAHIMNTLGLTMQPDGCEGATITIDNVEIGIRNAQQAPATPVIEEIGISSVALETVDGCEYSINGIDWQDSAEFSGLFAGNSYTFSQRYKETVKLLPSDVTTLNYNLVMRGDTDADGEITDVDSVEICKALLGVLVIKDTDFDFTYDNTFDIRDLVAIEMFTLYSTSSDLMIGSNPIEDFNVISDTDLISIQARDELIEAMNSFKEGSVKASDTISGTNDIILSIDYDNMDTDNYELKVENNVITLKAGSNYALLEGARALAIRLSEIADGKIVRFVNGYVLRG